MVFCNGVLERHPVVDKVLSSHRVQHQGGGNTHLTKSNNEGDINPDPRIELNEQGEFAGNHNLMFSEVIFIERQTL